MRVAHNAGCLRKGIVSQSNPVMQPTGYMTSHTQLAGLVCAFSRKGKTLSRFRRDLDRRVVLRASQLAKGLNEENGRPIVNKEAYYSKNKSVTVMPGAGGAHNWSPMSFNPNAGLVYIPTSSSSSGTYSVSTTFNYDPTRTNMGVQMGGQGGGGGAGAGRGGAAATDSPEAIAARAAVPPAAAPPKPVQRPDMPKTGPATTGGSLVAYDPVTQNERWHVEGGGGIGSGTVTTAGNLVIQVLNTGKLPPTPLIRARSCWISTRPRATDGTSHYTGQFAGDGRGFWERAFICSNSAACAWRLPAPEAYQRNSIVQ
jgi:hypothetical protein